MASKDDRLLSHPDYWDSRYSVSDGEGPTHEWFRSFTDLEPFFQTNLFSVQGRAPDDQPYFLHLDSGDSVCP